MDFAEYVERISFRYLQPERKRPTGFRKLAMWLRKLNVHLEMYNTSLPCDQQELRRRLQPLCGIPRMSTFAIGAMINRAVAQMSDEQAFVNVGVWHGYTFLCGLAGNGGKQCIGVDNFSHKNSPREEFYARFQRHRGEGHLFHEMDYHDYFNNVHSGPIGVYLFDGPHTYKDQLDGLRLAEPFFGEGCIVLVDDTNWEQVRRANLDFIAQSANRYGMLLDRRTPKSGHPTYWNGMMLFQLRGPNQLQAAEPVESARSRSAAA